MQRLPVRPLPDERANGVASRRLLVPRLVASMISVVLVGLGALAIATDHYFGRSSKSGGAEVSLDGAPALAMGIATVLFGLCPLALWFRRGRGAGAWATCCIVAAAIAVVVALRV